MDSVTVALKLEFSKKRLDDLHSLIAKNMLGQQANDRQQIIQEFFFHLLGATEYLAQLVNKKMGLSIPINEVNVHKVEAKLKPTDSLTQHIKGLSADTRKNALPADPYNDDGLIYRAINYRNEVVHRNANPFHFKMGSGPLVAHFWLDPRDHSKGHSINSVDSDLNSMYSLVELKCNSALAILK